MFGISLQPEHELCIAQLSEEHEGLAFAQRCNPFDANSKHPASLLTSRIPGERSSIQGDGGAFNISMRAIGSFHEFSSPITRAKKA